MQLQEQLGQRLHELHVHRRGRRVEIQQCPGSNGATNYTFGSQSCSCLPGDSTGCDACRAQVTYFCQEGDGGSSSGSGSGSGGEMDSGDDGGSSSGSDGAPLDDASMPPCNLSVSGPVNGTFACVVTLNYSTAGKRSSLSIQVPMPKAFQEVVVSAAQPGLPMTGTWSSSDTGATGGVTVIAPASGMMDPTWQCSAGGANGSYTIDIKVEGGMPTPGGEAFGVTGTLDATMPAKTSTGATGTLTMHATF